MAAGGSPGRGKSGSGRGKSLGREESPISTRIEWPKTREEFVKWFWSGTNGNDLIKELNGSESHGGDYNRQEKERPTIYGIVLNDGSFPGKVGKVQWTLCNVGFTHFNTATGTMNRMEQVIMEIERKYESRRKDRKPEAAAAAVLFVLPIGAVDVTTFSALAKTMGLPCSTKWVLTTQQFIEEIKRRKQERKAEGSTDLIDFFKDLKFKDFAYREPPWVSLNDDDGVPTVMDLTVQG